MNEHLRLYLQYLGEGVLFQVELDRYACKNKAYIKKRHYIIINKILST